MDTSLLVYIGIAVLALGLLAVLTAKNGSAPTAPPRALTATEEATIRGILAGGNKIQAIKAFRELTGAGLKESKDAVEALEKR